MTKQFAPKKFSSMPRLVRSKRSVLVKDKGKLYFIGTLSPKAMAQIRWLKSKRTK